MTDRVLTPCEVTLMERRALWPYKDLARLCGNYITLWDELEHEREISDKWERRVTQLEQEIGALTR